MKLKTCVISFVLLAIAAAPAIGQAEKKADQPPPKKAATKADGKKSEKKAMKEHASKDEGKTQCKPKKGQGGVKNPNAIDDDC